MIKTIYILWFQGFENSPKLVKMCLQSWIHYNPKWNIIQLDNTNLKNYLDFDEHIKDINTKNISFASFSDIVRIILLKKYGGLWVDATTFCNKSLDTWLEQYISNGFFAFSYNEYHDRLLSSWFLYGDVDNYIIDKWYYKVIEYCNSSNVLGRIGAINTLNKWKNKVSDDHYFWFHYLFGDLYETDDKFKEIWNNIKKISAIDCHFIQKKLFEKINNNIKNHIDNKKVNLYKLSYKFGEIIYEDGNVVKYLSNTININ